MGNPDKPRNRPSVLDVLPLLRSVYERHCAGCCLHIMTDDYNCEQHSADFCLNEARESGHEDCLAAAEMMVQMTTTQRLKASRSLRIRSAHNM